MLNKILKLIGITIHKTTYEETLKLQQQFYPSIVPTDKLIKKN